MNSFRTHLTVLDESASKYASSPAFKVPKLDPRSGRIQEWHPITYQEVKKDVELFARYWAHALQAQGVPQRSIVGIWIGGTTYTDALHVYGVTRAGYVPQLFSLRLPSPTVIYELLRKANAKALIYDASYESILSDSHVPTFLAVDAKNVDPDNITERIPDVPAAVNGDDTVFLFHTSGSTSGIPKLVPWSYSFITSAVDKSAQYNAQSIPVKKMVSNWIGSVCHAGQHLGFLAYFQVGACIIQPTTVNFPPEELQDMVERGGLNRFQQMGSYLAENLRHSRHDAKHLALIRGFTDVGYGGLPMPREAEEWAKQNNINLRTTFASTECGLLMFSVRGTTLPVLFRPVEGVSYEFRPVTLEDDADATSGNKSAGVKLLELIVLSNSPDCPHPSFRHADGHFHTGDFFEEVHPGQYASRGRNDDWIKSANGLRCDTKAIENNVGATCGHLVSICVVVGYGRSSPTLFVEASVDMDHEELKKEIIRATRPFNSRRYLHEQIISEKMIVVVPPNALPRTSSKGNIRRKAVEEAYKEQIDAIYASL